MTPMFKSAAVAITMFATTIPSLAMPNRAMGAENESSNGLSLVELVKKAESGDIQAQEEVAGVWSSTTDAYLDKIDNLNAQIKELKKKPGYSAKTLAYLQNQVKQNHTYVRIAQANFYYTICVIENNEEVSGITLSSSMLKIRESAKEFSSKFLTRTEMNEIKEIAKFEKGKVLPGNPKWENLVYNSAPQSKVANNTPSITTGWHNLRVG